MDFFFVFAKVGKGWLSLKCFEIKIALSVVVCFIIMLYKSNRQVTRKATEYNFFTCINESVLLPVLVQYSF